MKHYWLYLAAPLVLAPFCAAGNAQARANDNADKNVLPATGGVNPQPLKPATDDPNYAIGVEDVLTIDVWKEAEISRTVPVRPDGKISLPLLNDLQAAGLTPTQLGNEITQKLRSSIVNPRVTVIVAQINSQRIYITGQVTHGGVFPLLPGMTAVQALSGAGGFTIFANVKKIYVMRAESGQKRMFPINLKEVLKGHQTQQDIQLEPGDTIVVP